MTEHTGPTEIAVMLKGRKADGSITTWESKGWTTKCPHLVITPKADARNQKTYILTHAPSGFAVMNVPEDMPALFRLAEQLSRFDWSSPDIYETRPDDWGQRQDVVRTWYLALEDDASDDDSGWTVRA